jgi:hypothetical protein
MPSDFHNCSDSTACSALVRVGTQNLSLRAAVDALSAGGGTLELPAGYFTGNGSCGVVVRQSNVTIRGAAWPLETVIDCAGRDRHMVLLGSNISLERLRFVGGAAAPRACDVAAAMGLDCARITGGGCLLVAGGPASVSDCRIESCTASGDGGGVAAYGPLTLQRVQVDGCTARRGGGVYSHGEVSVVNSSLEGNAAWQGGGIFVLGAAAALVGHGVTLAGNTAQNSGGGLQAEDCARVRLGERSQVRGNTAGANGGGIYLYLWAELVLEADAAVAENHVTDGSNAYGGGGVCGFEETRVELRDRSMVVSNVAEISAGGGLRLTHGSALIMRDDAVIGSNIGTMGGGMFFDQKGTVNVSGRSAVEYNIATWYDGGGFYLGALSYTYPPLTGHGPVFLYMSGNAAVRGNVAADNGGGICASGRGGWRQQSHLFLTDDVVFEGNSNGIQGGAINVEWYTSLIVDGRVRMEGNTVGQMGGAIMGRQQAIIHLGGQTVVRNNAATLTAGAIGLDGSELSVDDNVAIYSNSGGRFGGGIGARSQSIINLGGATRVEDNCAGSGGGVYVTEDCTLTVGGAGRVVSNQAMTGGGVFAQASTLSILDNATVGWNQAALHGGGILLSAGAVQVQGAVSFAHNRAGQAGGGLYMALQSGMSVDGGVVIEDNKAGPFLLGDCAAALASAAGLTGGEKSGAGGGIFARDDGKLILRGGVAVRNNSAAAGGGISIRYVLGSSTKVRSGRRMHINGAENAHKWRGFRL